MKPQYDIKNIKPETAVLIGVITKQQPVDLAEEYLAELEFLAETAGAVTMKKFFQRLDHPDMRTYIGKGKLAEVAAFVQANEINLVVFDDELSGAQMRNIEKELKCKILDRTNLILDIFAKRARTAQAKVQVELAQYRYLLPRLTRMWTHLEKQRGGIGLRGPGESEIETDRRAIKNKLTVLKQKLNQIERVNETQRKARGNMVRVALVGYTNAGKSTIMNLLSKSDVFAENKLFATLDTTVRKIVWNHIPFLLSDTVGFIRKLPHDLVESFKSTLDEVREADLLIHVVDISHPHYEEQLNVVKQTLVELNAADKPTLLVFNKTDLFTYTQKEPDDLTEFTRANMSLDDLKKSYMAKEHAPCLFISALKKENIDSLRNQLLSMVGNIHHTRYPNVQSLQSI